MWVGEVFCKTYYISGTATREKQSDEWAWLNFLITLWHSAFSEALVQDLHAGIEKCGVSVD